MESAANYVTQLDVSMLCQALEKLPWLFGEFGWRKERYAHEDMTDIWVRYNDPKNIGPTFNDEHSSIWYPVVQHLPEVPIICVRLMQAVIGERLGGVLITKLAPGGEIKPHVDEGWHASYYSKFWVPVKNLPGARFCWEDGTAIEPDPGEVYEFRNDIPHWVVNESPEDRIAMIVCIRKLMDSLIEASSSRQKPTLVRQDYVKGSTTD